MDETCREHFKLQSLKDVMIFKRPSNVFTFVLLYDDFDYTLKDYIIRNKNKQSTAPEDTFFIANAMTSLVARLKAIGISHNNLSPENVMIHNQAEKQPKSGFIENNNYANKTMMRNPKKFMTE